MTSLVGLAKDIDLKKAGTILTQSVSDYSREIRSRARYSTCHRLTSVRQKKNKIAMKVTTTLLVTKD